METAYHVNVAQRGDERALSDFFANSLHPAEGIFTKEYVDETKARYSETFIKERFLSSDFAIALHAIDKSTGKTVGVMITTNTKPGSGRAYKNALTPRRDCAVSWILVSPDHRQQGIAEMMLHEAEIQAQRKWKARTMSAAIRPLNNASLKLFRGLGYQREGFLHIDERLDVFSKKLTF